MSTLSIQASYRPLKIGSCIAEGAFDELRHAIRLTSTLWGGCFNPIIIIGEDTQIAEQLANTYRVDLLYALNPTSLVTAFLDKFPHLSWPAIHRDLFIRGTRAYQAHFLDISHPLDSLRKKPWEPHTAPQAVRRIQTDPRDPLRDVVLATFGDYPEGDDCPINYAAMVERLQGLTTDQLPLDGALPLDAWETVSPLRLTEWGLLVYFRRGSWDPPGVFIGRADSLTDLVTFWNLRAANIEVQFLPEADYQRVAVFVQGWMARVRSSLAQRQVPFDGMPAVWSRDRDFTSYRETIGEPLLHH